jgi:thiosulfate/3-mercaptopyruvate sulfurtransferase
MDATALPLIVSPAHLQAYRGEAPLLIVDLGDQQAYEAEHVPGAVHLPFPRIIASQPPAMGLLPSEETLSEVLSAIGLSAQHHVVAYDHDGNGRASRLLWTLDVLGHSRFSLLDGGLAAWREAAPELGLQVERGASEPPSRSAYQARIAKPEHLADKDYLLAHLHDANLVILDARTAGEYDGSDRRAARAGHIPGAVNLDWALTKDPARQGRLRPEAELRAMLERVGATPDKEIVTHCQTHHRSAHTYIVLKLLGYPRVRGYPGSWSEWGNDPATPVQS